MREHVVSSIALLAASLCLVPVGAAGAEPLGAALSLDAAVALALERNPDYRIAHTAVVASGARLRAAAGPQLPTVALRDSFAYANPVAELSTPFGALPFSSTTTTNVPLLTVQYALFDGGRTAAHVSQAAAELAAADARERAARMALIDTTATAYFGLVAARESAVVTERSIDTAGAHLVDAEHLFAAGQVPRADVLRAQTDLANERVHGLSAQHAIALAQAALDDVLALPLDEVHAPTDPLDVGVPDFALPTLIASANANRGDVAAARAAIDAATDAVREARSRRAPHVGVVVADGNVQPAVAPGYRNQFSIGLGAVWTLFDNGSVAGDVAAAQSGIDVAKLSLEKLQSEAELQVRTAYLNLTDARARVVASGTYVALAEENLRLARVRYRGGVGTLLELQDAELQATTSRQALIDAEVAVRVGIVHVRFNAGLL